MENRPKVEQAPGAECPEQNVRCTKLARRAIAFFQREPGERFAGIIPKPRDYFQIDPRAGGIAWNFTSDSDHYDHIRDAVLASGVEVEDTFEGRIPSTETVPTYGLRRVESNETT